MPVHRLQARVGRLNNSRTGLPHDEGFGVIVVRRSLRRLLVVSALVVVAGSTAVSATTTAPPLGSAVQSSVEGVSFPSAAVLVPMPTESNGVRTVYRLPIGVKRAALVKWYKKQLPMGKPFGSWSWCQKTVADDYVQRIWTHPGTRDMLFVELEFPKGSSHPP